VKRRKRNHHLVAKLLSKRARHDIQTAVAFLSTRVNDPDTHNYKKLTRVMQYIRDMTKFTLTIKLSDTQHGG